MIKLQSYLIQMWGNGRWRISKDQQHLDVDTIDEVFDLYFLHSKYGFLQFYHRMRQLTISQCEQDAEIMAIAQVADQTHSEVANWLSGYNRYMKTNISLSEIDLETISQRNSLNVS